MSRRSCAYRVGRVLSPLFSSHEFSHVYPGPFILFAHKHTPLLLSWVGACILSDPLPVPPLERHPRRRRVAIVVVAVRVHHDVAAQVVI
jgi:hypothetical protein